MSQPTIAVSIRELAKLVGRSNVAVSRWVVDPRWPFARNGPWNAETVGKISAWAAETLVSRPSGTAATPADDLSRSEKQVRIKGGLERAKYTETRRKILEGDFLVRAEVDADRVERIQCLKTGLFDTVDSGLVEMLREADNIQDAKDLLRARFILLCQNFSAGKD